eukprot:scaffold118660_cov16-Tisochrysis_lutea.AAC.2
MLQLIIQPISCNQLVAAGADPDAAAGKPATHAARRLLLAALPKLGVHKRMDGEPDYDGKGDVLSWTSGPLFLTEFKKRFSLEGMAG